LGVVGQAEFAGDDRVRGLRLVLFEDRLVFGPCLVQSVRGGLGCQSEMGEVGRLVRADALTVEVEDVIDLACGTRCPLATDRGACWLSVRAHGSILSVVPSGQRWQ